MKPIRISCYGCEIFSSLLPLQKIRLFQEIFILLHKNYEKQFAQILKPIGKEKEEYIAKWLLEETCTLCRQGMPGGVGLYDHAGNCHHLEIEKMPWLNLPTAWSIDRLNLAKRLIAKDRLWEMGAWPNDLLKSDGIAQRPYFNEKYFGKISDEEAQLLFLQDYKDKKEYSDNPYLYPYLDLIINLEKPLEELVRAFRKTVKKIGAERYKGLYTKDEKRKKEPDFEVWDKYIMAYLLWKKKVNPKLLNPNWPSGKLTRRKAAELLFDYLDDRTDKVQKFKDYIDEAEILIEEAEAYKGIFSCCTDSFVIPQ